MLNRADDPHLRWHTELILGIHYRVLASDYSRGAGRFRASQNLLVDALAQRQVYLPPSPQEVPILVADLADWMHSEEDVPVPVASALVHARLAGIHPFSDGNGRTAGILSSLAMHRGGQSARVYQPGGMVGSPPGGVLRLLRLPGPEWDPAGRRDCFRRSARPRADLPG